MLSTFKAKGLEFLSWINRLHQTEILSTETRDEYVQLIKKGMRDEQYYTIVLTKLEREFGSGSNDANLSESKKNFVNTCISELKKI